MSGRPRLRAYLAFAVAGFRRHSTYRQATVAACVTNVARLYTRSR